MHLVLLHPVLKATLFLTDLGSVGLTATQLVQNSKRIKKMFRQKSTYS